MASIEENHTVLISTFVCTTEEVFHIRYTGPNRPLSARFLVNEIKAEAKGLPLRWKTSDVWYLRLRTTMADIALEIRSEELEDHEIEDVMEIIVDIEDERKRKASDVSGP